MDFLWLLLFLHHISGCRSEIISIAAQKSARFLRLRETAPRTCKYFWCKNHSPRQQRFRCRFWSEIHHLCKGWHGGAAGARMLKSIGGVRSSTESLSKLRANENQMFLIIHSCVMIMDYPMIITFFQTSKQHKRPSSISVPCISLIILTGLIGCDVLTAGHVDSLRLLLLRHRHLCFGHHGWAYPSARPWWRWAKMETSVQRLQGVDVWSKSLRKPSVLKKKHVS